ncbi:MAG: hypothetical protein PF961_21385 [Planctomycetota bacterium]|jgi:hypothetical protein|nr:hypothetical protein [Planctomycetota bacterium]
MTEESPLLYQHSGKMGSAPLLVPVLGVPLLFVTSLIYGYIAVYSPIVGYLTVLILLGYVFVNGFGLALIARFARCRSERFLWLAGLGAGLVALYFSWAEFEHALINRYASGGQHVAQAEILLSPGAMWGVAGEIAAEGWYAVFGATPSGFVLWLMWLVEAGIIVGGVTLFTAAAISREVYCEDCGKWCGTAEECRLKIDPEFLTRPVESVSHAELLALPPQKGRAYPHVKAEVLCCEKCKQTTAMRFSRLTQEVNSDGKKEEKSQDIPGILLQPRE